MSHNTIAVDFDGVLHAYTSPWVAAHVIPDPPVEGAINWLSSMLTHYDIVIVTTRGRTWRGRRAVRHWLRRYADGFWHGSLGGRGLEDIVVTAKKVPALVYIDDRAWRFDGKFPTVDEITNATPWNKR